MHTTKSQHKHSTQPIILKFGGTSVSTRESWENIASIAQDMLKTTESFVVIVVSALAGVSDILEQLPDSTAETGVFKPPLMELWSRHEALGRDLGIWDASTAQPYFDELDQLLQGIALTEEATPRLRARILSMGEVLSSTLGARFLSKCDLSTRWLDARECLKVDKDRIGPTPDDEYLSARCVYDFDQGLLDELSGSPERIFLTQGFIAGNDIGDTCLLGRGGSDTSGSYFAAKLNAERLEIWTDVSGIFTANPKHFPDARLVRRVSYEEALTLTSYGAGVLHPRCIIPARDHDIPIHVRQTTAPTQEGTVVWHADEESEAEIKAVTSRQHLHLIRLSRPGQWQPVGFLSDIAQCFSDQGLSIDMLSSSLSEISATIDPAYSPMTPDREELLMKALMNFCEPRPMQSVASISIVGSKVRSQLHKLSRVLRPLEGAEIHLLNQASDDYHLSLVIDQSELKAVLHILHAELFGQVEEGSTFGPRWKELVAKREAERQEPVTVA